MTSKWIQLAAFLGALAFLAAACSRQDNDNPGPTTSAQGGSSDPGSSVTSGTVDGSTVPAAPGPPLNYEKAAITNLSEVFNTNNPTAFWSRAVDLSGVTVQQIFADRQFITVGPDKNHALPVQMSELHPEIKAGQKVDIRGVIDPTGHDKSQWNVLPAERQVLAQHSIFIQERSIKLSAQ